VLLGQQQKLDESIAESKEAIRLKPDSAKAHYVLALALSTQGKKQEAIQNLTKTQELLKTQGKTEEADKIAQVIKQLGEQKQ
jgi:tetratricopeptide (TPR) repeat protein